MRPKPDEEYEIRPYPGFKNDITKWVIVALCTALWVYMTIRSIGVILEQL